MKELYFTSLWAAVMWLTVAICGCAVISPRSDQFRPTLPQENIPDGHHSYTVLLFSDYGARAIYTETDIEKIDDSFRFFGRAIGENNLAVVLLNADKKTHSVERAMSIIDNINRQSTRRIDYSSAPIIIYTNFNPEKEKPKDGFITAIAFREADPSTITKVLTRLTQAIRTGNRPELEYEEKALLIEGVVKHIKVEFNLWNIFILKYE